MKPYQVFLSSVALSVIALADTVDNGEIVTFSPGTPASAADVNQTIQELISAINDNAADIAALEAVNAETLEQKMHGSSWQISITTVALGLVEQTIPIPVIDQYTDPVLGTTTDTKAIDIGQYINLQKLSVTLNADGSLSGTMVSDQGREFNLNQSATVWNGSEIGDGSLLDDTGGQTTVGPSPLPGGSNSWSLSGKTLTLTIDGEPTSFTVSSSADMLIAANSFEDNVNGPTLFQVVRMIGIRSN